MLEGPLNHGPRPFPLGSGHGPGEVARGLAGSGYEQLCWLTATKSFATGAADQGQWIREFVVLVNCRIGTGLLLWRGAGQGRWNRLSSQERGNCPVSVQPWVALCVSVRMSVWRRTQQQLRQLRRGAHPAQLKANRGRHTLRGAVIKLLWFRLLSNSTLSQSVTQKGGAKLSRGTVDDFTSVWSQHYLKSFWVVKFCCFHLKVLQGFYFLNVVV